MYNYTYYDLITVLDTCLGKKKKKGSELNTLCLWYSPLFKISLLFNELL